MRLLKVVVVLVILILAGLAGYAYFGDMTSDPSEIRVPVPLDLGAAPATAPAETPAAAGDSAEPAPQTATPANDSEAGAATGQDSLD